MTTNYEWQHHQAKERIDERMKEASSHRLTRPGIEKRKHSISFNRTSVLIVKTKAKIIDFFSNGLEILQKHDVKV